MAIHNNLIQFKDCYFKQKNCNITGDNNSVAIANITLHFIMLKVPNTCKVLLIKRFIDDIVFILENKDISREIIKSLKDTFEKHNPKITSQYNVNRKQNNSFPRCRTCI